MTRRATRRRLVAGIGAVGTAATGGCLDVLTGSEPARFTAGTATVPGSVLDETEFRPAGGRTQTVERTFSAAGQSRTVEVRNRVVEYDRSVSLPGRSVRAAAFTAFASPAVDLFGQTFNPLGESSPTEIARRAVASYDSLGNLRRTETESAQLVDTSVEVGVFEADATITDGVDVTVVLRVTEAVRAGADFVVAVGGYPRLVDQSDAIRTLTTAVEHTNEAVTVTDAG